MEALGIIIAVLVLGMLCMWLRIVAIENLLEEINKERGYIDYWMKSIEERKQNKPIEEQIED